MLARAGNWGLLVRELLTIVFQVTRGPTPNEVTRMARRKTGSTTGRTVRRVLGAAGASSLAVLAGIALAEQSRLDAASRPVSVPALASILPEAPVASGLSGSIALRPATEPRSARLEPPDAAPPPAPRAARPHVRDRREAAREARTARAAMVARLARVLDGFATGLDAATERAVAAAIYDESRRRNIDPLLTLAVIETESTYRNGAISFVGARGLMQIRPFVGEELAGRLRLSWAGHETLHDPIANVKMGVYYLAQLRGRFGDLATALAAYNIGPNAVQGLIDEEREVPTGYVRKVLASYGRLLADTSGRPALAARSPLGSRR